MADLGTAVLTIEVDQKGFEASLAQAKQTIQRELGGTIQTATQRGARGNQGGNRGRDAELRAASQLLRLRNSINILEANGVNVSRLRSRLSDLETLAADKKYRALKQEGEALRQIVSQEQNRLRVDTIRTREAQKQVQLNEKQSAAAVALNKQRDEAFRKAVAQAQRETRFAASYGPQLPKPARATGGGTASAEAAERRLARERERAAKATERAAQREAKRIETERKAAAQQRRDIISNIAIGAGFPLLFGQGFGAAAGGALGGGLGGALGGTAGFAGSIVGTALGQAFDTALQKAQTLAQGLEDPIKNFDALKEAALISSRSTEKQVEALIEAGRTGEAYAIIQADLAESFGSAAEAKKYQQAVDSLNREWTKATLTLANFVAGPLAEFLTRLRLAAGGRAQGPQETGIRTQQQSSVAKALLAFGPQIAGLGLAGAATGVGAPVGLGAAALGATLTGIGAGLAGGIGEGEADKILASIPQAVAAAKKIREERERDLAIQNLSNKATIESLRGNQLIAEQAEKRRLELEKARAIETAPAAERAGIADRYDAQIAQAQEKVLQAQQKIDLSAFQELQKRQQIEQSIANTVQLLGTESGIQRDTLRTVQQITASITEARQRETDLGFQIGQARLGGREEEAARLVEQQRTAATETRARLVEGALALTEAAEKLRDNVRDAAVRFTEVRASAQGLNRFLSPEARGRRAEQNFQILQPFFREAQARFTQLTGERAPEFAGTAEGINASIRDFITAVNQEFQARRDLQGAEASLQEVNKALVDVNSQLLGATQALAQKDWVVNIEVVNQAGGASTVNTVNSLAS